MIVKMAILFLAAMAAAGMILGRRKRPGKIGRKGGGGRARFGRGKTAEAARCPDCGAWIVAGARCPCADEKG